MTGDYPHDSCFPVLLAQHQQTLCESAISEQVQKARGYRSVITKVELRKAGFNEAQSHCVPALLIPTYRPDGEPGLIQMRPDEPRRFPDGRIAKYEMPSKEQMCLDVPPTVRKHIGNPTVPLFITEGIKKGDALASLGVCVVTVLGVTCWRGTNEYGGKTALADWHDVALNDREIIIVFDSDVMRKKPVYLALRSVRDYLQSKGAKVAFIYLPTGENGTKTGVDDYLAQGKTLDDLLRLVTDQLLVCPGSDEEDFSLYQETENGLVWNKPTRDGTMPFHLTNFTARIVEQVTADDGAETQQEYVIEAKRNGRQKQFSVPLSAFPTLQWAAQHLGSATIVYPGITIKDHAVAAIRLLSGEPPERKTFTHTGWRQMENGVWGYLHAGGILGQEIGEEVTVRLEANLQHFALPAPPTEDEQQTALQATLRLLELADDRIMFPLLASVFRAALATADFSLSLVGQSGCFKSELASLAQRFFGKDMDANRLPASWSSTDNALEDLAFRAKDALLVIDDFAPTPGDIHQWHKKADRVLRAQGNNAGRQRMLRDGTLRLPRPPRGLILLTGEDVPQGQSLKARQFIVEVEPGDITSVHLTACQHDAAAGLYASCMAGFLFWIAPGYPAALERLSVHKERLRNEAANSGLHRRTPDIVADLAIGLDYFLRFAHSVQAITDQENHDLWERGWTALCATATKQAVHQQASDPGQRFIELIRSALSSGRAHIADRDGGKPEQPEAWGWRREISGGESIWKPHGERIGWIDGEALYLEKDAAYQMVQRSSSGEEGIALSPSSLFKRLHTAGLIYREGKREANTVRRILEGKQQTVLHLAASTLLGTEPDKSNIANNPEPNEE